MRLVSKRPSRACLFGAALGTLSVLTVIIIVSANNVVISGNLLNPIGPPDQFRGDIIRIFRFDGPEAYKEAVAIRTDFANATLPDMTSLLLRIEAKGGKLEQEVKLDAPRYHVRTNKGVLMLMLMCKGYGWIEVVEVNHNCTVNLDTGNAIRGFG